MEENSRNTCSSFKVAYEKKTKVDALLRKGSKAAERVRNSGFNAYFHWHLEVQYSILICRCLYLETYHFIWQQAYDKRSVWQEREEKESFITVLPPLRSSATHMIRNNHPFAKCIQYIPWPTQFPHDELCRCKQSRQCIELGICFRYESTTATAKLGSRKLHNTAKNE